MFLWDKMAIVFVSPMGRKIGLPDTFDECNGKTNYNFISSKMWDYWPKMATQPLFCRTLKGNNVAIFHSLSGLARPDESIGGKIETLPLFV